MMVRTRIVVIIITLFLQQYIDITQAVTCASNPCNLVPGVFDPLNGYCCYDVPPNYAHALCTCPNNVTPVVNAPCRTNINQARCTKLCVNGGVCNIVSGQEVCWCQLGFTGPNCEVQGIRNRCYAGLCQSGTCYEQETGATTYAYCQCTPGWRGITCNQNYFTCTRQGVFPDTAQCAIGRYFYCPQAFGAPTAALCPLGQRFNRLTYQCDSTYQCT
ncbi:unnamed protein product [Rotaria sp. Silwood1]|nr:unnamed protein product [Rotaria sp. Silwood1]CAF1361727.1 unnamed protein product [Rotaria sp. Silwood1]CAF3507285.1 unnamed protein product [Rotaria sp. Silwood1]CAF3594528.1 unnamed protein product [Rotaria sp. Silwood1]CAF3605938.1 unnamed protein product [Rotaria sp. Silwood1]